MEVPVAVAHKAWGGVDSDEEGSEGKEKLHFCGKEREQRERERVCQMCFKVPRQWIV